MKYPSRYSVLICLTAATLLAVGLLAYIQHAKRTRVTLASTSPDGRYLIKLVEKNQSLDRNFDVILDDLHTRSSIHIFSSPDEGRPPGTEEINWTSDSRFFLLRGR